MFQVSKRGSDVDLSVGDVTAQTGTTLMPPGDSSVDTATIKPNITVDGTISAPIDTSGTTGANNLTLDQTTHGGSSGGEAGGSNNTGGIVQETSGDVPPEDAKDKGVGDLEITPVTAAIARYLNIDLSPEGKASENRRGIAIVVYGAPESGWFPGFCFLSCKTIFLNVIF